MTERNQNQQKAAEQPQVSSSRMEFAAAAKSSFSEQDKDSFSVEIPTINLPKGGGAIKGIDEKFAVNSVNGTATFSIPLPVTEARGFAPQLSVNYNSGNG